MGIFYLVPVIAIVLVGLYYLNIYRKGKAAGGGFMAGVQNMHQERWQDLLEPGEQLQVFGSGVQWRPMWQHWLSRQFPMLQLVWPTKMYEMVLTSRGRLVMGKSAALGRLLDKKRYEKSSVQVSNSFEEQQGFAMKLNPMAKDYKTFEAVLTFPDASLRLCTIPKDFLAALTT
jgi:hypothetical protein